MESVLTLIVENKMTTKRVAQFALIICGILSSLIYITANILGAIQWNEYSTVSQTVSELMAIDAPSRNLMLWFMIAYSLLIIAFSKGVWNFAGRRLSLRILAGLLTGFGIICLLGPYAPMHQREVIEAGGATLTDLVHIIMTIINVLFILLIVGFGASSFGRMFKIYSIYTIFLILIFGILSSLYTQQLQLNLPTPWIGITERICIGAFMIWIVILALNIITDLSNKRLLTQR